MCVKVFPGRAYVKGYDVDLNGTTILDIEKPRDKKEIELSSVPFKFGNKFQINNVNGTPKFGINISNTINLCNQRKTTANATGVSGTDIGIAKVYAFEPMEKSFEELKKIKEQYKDRFFIEKLALGNEDGVKQIYSANDKSEKASLEKNLEKLSFIDKNNLRKFDVSIKKIDSLNFFDTNSKVDFVKIDVEGFTE